MDDAVLDALDDGAAFEGVSKYPNRVKCALLGWMALKDAVAKAVVNGENQVASGSASAAHCDE